MGYKDAKEFYTDLPHLLKILFWALGCIVFIILLLAYHKHSIACDNNKSDDFFGMKCYQKIDTVKITIEKPIFKDTCINKQQNIDTFAHTLNVNSHGQKGGQTAGTITNNH